VGHRNRLGLAGGYRLPEQVERHLDLHSFGHRLSDRSVLHVHGVCQSPIEDFQSRFGAAKGLIGQKSNHVGKQFRLDSRHHAPHRPNSRFFHLA
jgi:hypothetical protein